MAQRKTSVLFLCTGNSCRSQIAEGWARELLADQAEPYSAGIEKRGLDPIAVAVMKEVGVDISHQQSTTVDELPVQEFDLVVTVCGHADENCPVFIGGPRIIHVGFDDPPKLAQAAASEDEALSHYIRVRDEIRALLERWSNSLPADWA